MRFIANYEVKSDISVISDDERLRFQDPKGHFQATIKNIIRDDYSTPFLLSLQIAFESISLEEAKDVAEDKLVECLNMISFTSGAGISRHRIKQLVDATPEAGMRDCLIWADSARHEDPSPFLHEKVIGTLEHLLQFEQPAAIRRAMRWYRIGIDSPIPEDQFQYFWFSLEILAEYQKSPVKVPDKCPHCKSPLYCETCEKHPEHKPYAKQAISALIMSVDEACDEETIKKLGDARNALMHGMTLKEIEEELGTSEEDIVDVLGKILFKALVHMFPNELFRERLHFGSPTTYVHRTLTGVAHVQTIVSNGADGDLDLDSLDGTKVTMETGRPPQSERPSIIKLSPEQHE